MFTPSNSDIIKIAYSTYSTFKDANCYYNKEMVNHKEILSRLKFIGKIEKGNKINTKHTLIWFTIFWGLWEYWYGVSDIGLVMVYGPDDGTCVILLTY